MGLLFIFEIALIALLKKIMGKFKNGHKHGLCTLTRLSDNKLMQSERFRNGKFVSASIYNTDFDYYGTIVTETIVKLPDDNRT